MTTRASDSRDKGRQVGSGATVEVDLDLARQGGLQLADPAVEDAQPLDRCAQDRQRVRRGMRPGQDRDLGRDIDRLAIALVLLARGVTFGAEPLGLAGLVEQAAPFGQRGFGLGPTVPRGGQRVAVPLELGQRQLALVERDLRLLDGLLGDLEASRVALAPRRQVVERLVELLAGPARAPVRAADRRLEPVAQGALVAGQVAQLEVVDRRGRAEEALGRDAGQLGHDLVGEGRVGDRLALVVEGDRALRARERLLEGADLLAVLVVLLEFDLQDRARLGWRAPRPERLELARGTRRAPGQGQLEGALDGRLAGLVRAADDGQTGRQLDVEGAIAPEVATLQPPDPHSDTS